MDASEATSLDVEVRGSSAEGNYTPDVTLYQETVGLQPGMAQEVWIRPDARAGTAGYIAYCLLRNPALSVHTSGLRVTGVLSLSQSMNRAVAKSARQDPPPGIGIDSFEFWLPTRRPAGRNLAIQIVPLLDLYGAENVRNGIARPTTLPNAWAPAPDDPAPRLTCELAGTPTNRPHRAGLRHRFRPPPGVRADGPPGARNSILRQAIPHPRRSGQGAISSARENHQTRNTIRLDPPASPPRLHLEVLATHGAPAAIFEPAAMPY